MTDLKLESRQDLQEQIGFGFESLQGQIGNGFVFPELLYTKPIWIYKHTIPKESFMHFFSFYIQQRKLQKERNYELVVVNSLVDTLNYLLESFFFAFRLYAQTPQPSLVAYKQFGFLNCVDNYMVALQLGAHTQKLQKWKNYIAKIDISSDLDNIHAGFWKEVDDFIDGKDNNNQKRIDQLAKKFYRANGGDALSFKKNCEIFLTESDENFITSGDKLHTKKPAYNDDDEYDDVFKSHLDVKNNN
jgi:hypothetical protein